MTAPFNRGHTTSKSLVEWWTIFPDQIHLFVCPCKGAPRKMSEYVGRPAVTDDRVFLFVARKALA